MENYHYTPFENLDKLLQVELRERNTPVGIIPRLYQTARGDGVPLSYSTAKVFIDRPKSKIGIVTGVEFHPYLPHGEIDGLPGAVVLARALGNLGHDVYILTTEGCVPVIDNLILKLDAPKTLSVNVSKLSGKELDQYAQEMEIGVAIEKIGINRKGITHTIEGQAFQEKGPEYADQFINTLNKRGKFTIGYGDGGNEIGFGKIFEEVRAIAPYGAKCLCPCSDGMATITATNIIWPVNVSNFGAYSTVAGLAILAKDPQLALTSEDLLLALDASVEAGAKDGGTGLAIPGEDGIPAPTAAAFVQIMNNIVEKNFQKFERPF